MQNDSNETDIDGNVVCATKREINGLRDHKKHDKPYRRASVSEPQNKSLKNESNSVHNDTFWHKDKQSEAVLFRGQIQKRGVSPKRNSNHSHFKDRNTSRDLVRVSHYI